MVRKEDIQMTFDRQRFKEELLVELLTGRVAKEDTLARAINKRAICSSNHLKNIRNRIVHIAVLFSIIILRTHDNHHRT